MAKLEISMIILAFVLVIYNVTDVATGVSLLYGAVRGLGSNGHLANYINGATSGTTNNPDSDK
jgi:hypothetical protein